MVAKLYVFSDLALITPIMVEYSDDFQGLPHSENRDLPHSAEPKINVCPIAKILKTGIGEDNATTKKHMREQHRDSGVYVRVYVVFYLAIKYLMLH